MTKVVNLRERAPKTCRNLLLFCKCIKSSYFGNSSFREIYLFSVVLFYSVSESRSSPEGDTTLFLSRLNTIWKGFINMQSVAKFVTKAYPVSGCFDYLSEVRIKCVCECAHAGFLGALVPSLSLMRSPC